MTNTTYRLPVGETVGTSWDKVSGSKGSFWAAIGISILISIALGLIGVVLSNIANFLTHIVGIISQIISGLISLGLLYMGILRARKDPINFRLMFYAFNWYIFIRVVGVYLIQFVIYLVLTLIFIFVPMIIFGTEVGDTLSTGFSLGNFLLASWIALGVIIGIYLMLRMILSMGLVLDKKVNSWPAIKLSFIATRKNEFRLFAIVICQILALILGAIPLGIGLIWTIPFSIIIYGTLYNSLLTNLPDNLENT